MKHISIIKNEIVTNEAGFDTQIELDAWYNHHVGLGTFGEHSVLIEDVTEKYQQQEQSTQALKFLNETDYKVLRHIRQQALGIATTLTAQEYLELEQERQMAAQTIA